MGNIIDIESGVHMGEKINVDTQGISDDWKKANGDYDTRSRGALDADQVLSAMLHLQPLDTPDGEDKCPPHVLTEGSAGQFSFVGQGGGIVYCIDIEQELSAIDAANLALGRITMKPPASTDDRIEITNTPPDPKQINRKFGWRSVFPILLGVCFFCRCNRCNSHCFFVG